MRTPRSCRSGCVDPQSLSAIVAGRRGAGNGGFCKRFPDLTELREMVGNPYMVRFEYADGVMGTCLLLSGDTRRCYKRRLVYC